MSDRYSSRRCVVGLWGAGLPPVLSENFVHRPAGADGAQIVEGEAARAVGIPQGGVAIGIAPHNSRFAASGKIASPDDLPAAANSAQVLIGEASRAIGIPKGGGAIGVAPQNTVFTSPAEVAGSGDLPAEPTTPDPD